MNLPYDDSQSGSYTGADLVILIPTKDRPEKLRIMLKTLSLQTEKCARILVIDGGESVESVVLEFKNVLPVEYHSCKPPGQIRQRNLGISLLKLDTRLVGFIDDDLLFEPDALEKMLEFWNKAPRETAGVGFNNVGVPQYTDSWLLKIFFMSSRFQGKVTKAGYNTSIGNVNKDIQTEWLGGGYTVWKQDIIRQFSQSELKTKWAIGEDIRFSYPIGQLYPLFVASEPKFREQMEELHVTEANDLALYRGVKSCLSYYYFVSMNSSLSKGLCFWMLLGKTVALLLQGAIRFDSTTLHRGYGYLKGLVIILGSVFGAANVVKSLED